MAEFVLASKRYDGEAAFTRMTDWWRAKTDNEQGEPQDAIGIAAIFGFPFKLYSEGVLPILDASANGFRYKVHPPIIVIPPGGLNTSPLSVNVPFELWPNFEWSETIAEKNRHLPASNPSYMSGNATKDYNAFRIDIWGFDSRTQVKPFSKRFLEWIRVMTQQSWVNSYDFHHDTYFKNLFGIDEAGKAIEQPITRASYTAQPIGVLTDIIWRDAFKMAVDGHEVPIHWTLYFDACNSYARENLWETVLHLTLSLEIARNTEFVRFCEHRIVKELVEFESPFNGTDLLKHLTVNLENKIGRNLAKENPLLGDKLRALYKARHLVAHGKIGVYHDHDSGIKPLNDEVVTEWLFAVSQIIVWMEDLK